MDIKEYIESYGYKVSDLTEKEMKEAIAEVEDINNGLEVVHSVLDPLGAVEMRLSSSCECK